MRVARPFVSHPRHPVTGKRLTVSARTKRELEARLHALDTMRQDLRLGLRTDGEASTALRGLERKRVTLLEAADSYASLARLAPRTRAAARNLVRDSGNVVRGRPVHGALFELAGERLEALTAPRVAKHFRRMAETHAWQSVITTWRRLRSIVRHAAEQGWITAAPWGMWRPAKPTHAKEGRARRECARNEAERQALIDAAWALVPSSVKDRTFPLAVSVALHTGARKGELAGLEWRDVLPITVSVGESPAHLTCNVRIERQYDRRPMKESGRRDVEVPHALAVWLRDVFEERGASVGAPIFPAPSGGHRKSGDVIDSNHLRLAVARAGLGDPKRWSPHSLRDSFVTIEAQACGGDLRRLAERTGHRSIDSLLRYLQTFDRTPRPALSP